jgi:hypothetical protein
MRIPKQRFKKYAIGAGGIQRFHGLQRRLSYANVMATLAFFFALTGAATAGVKYIATTDPIPSTSDLTGTYGNPLIGTGKVTTAKIADGAITSAKFDSSALAPNADKLDGIDSSQFVQGKVFYADVSRDGTVWASRGTLTTNALVLTGDYELTFQQDVTQCAWIVSRTQSQHTGDADPNNQLTAEPLGNFFAGDQDVIRVQAQATSGAGAGGTFVDQAFSLVVVC